MNRMKDRVKEIKKAFHAMGIKSEQAGWNTECVPEFGQSTPSSVPMMEEGSMVGWDQFSGPLVLESPDPMTYLVGFREIWFDKKDALL